MPEKRLTVEEMKQALAAAEKVQNNDTTDWAARGAAHGAALADVVDTAMDYGNKVFDYLGGLFASTTQSANYGHAPKNRSGNQSESSLGIVDRLKREIFDIEERKDLTIDDKVSQITHIACAACAGVAIQPIPFADIFILTPIQAYMGSRIAAIRGVPVSEAEASDLVKEILGVIGMGLAAQQVAIGIWKTVIPGAGGFMTIPIVYGLSYAIMRVMDAYFEAKAGGRKLSPEQIKALWSSAKAEGERRGQSYKPDKKA